jgi:hypothetical protein
MVELNHFIVADKSKYVFQSIETVAKLSDKTGQKSATFFYIYGEQSSSTLFVTLDAFVENPSRIKLMCQHYPFSHSLVVWEQAKNLIDL